MPQSPTSRTCRPHLKPPAPTCFFQSSYAEGCHSSTVWREWKEHEWQCCFIHRHGFQFHLLALWQLTWSSGPVSIKAFNHHIKQPNQGISCLTEEYTASEWFATGQPSKVSKVTSCTLRMGPLTSNPPTTPHCLLQVGPDCATPLSSGELAWDRTAGTRKDTAGWDMLHFAQRRHPKKTIKRNIKIQWPHKLLFQNSLEKASFLYTRG